MTARVEAAYQEALGSPVARHEVRVEDVSPFDVLEYRDVPATGAVTVTSHGLSCAVPKGVMPSTRLAQELLMCCWDRFYDSTFVKLLAVVARERVLAGQALAWGEVLPPAGQLLPSTAMEALYVSQPGYFNPSLACIDQLEPAIRVRWLIPIHASEAIWIAAHGHEAFEDVLEREDPDLLDLERPPAT